MRSRATRGSRWRRSRRAPVRANRHCAAWWRSRQHLVVEALATTIGTSPTPDTGCTHCDLIAGINTLGQAFAAPALRHTLSGLVADLADDPELAATFLDTFFAPRRASTAEALRRGIARGDIAPDADIDLLLDMLASTTYYRALFGHLPVTEGLAEDVVRVVLSGVGTERWRARWAARDTHED